MSDTLELKIVGPAATALALRLFPCPCPVPKVRLSFALSQLPKGTVITMPPTTGTPVSVSFPVPAPGAANQKFTFHVTATDENGASVVPTGLTAVSDNPLLVPTLNADAISFDIAVNSPDALTGNVTITDATGDTLVVSIAQTSGVPNPPVPSTTLSGFADPPVSQ